MSRQSSSRSPVSQNMQKKSRRTGLGYLFGLLVSIICVTLSLHLVLSYFNFVPSEVRSANEEIMVSLQDLQNSFHTQVYTRTPDQRTNLPQVTSTNLARGTQPTLVEIPSIDISEKIYSPGVPEIEVLDQALTKGVVHYPGSGLLGQDRTVFLFGHSSSRSFVHNRAYQAFNGIEELSLGDKIYVSGEDKTYVYSVTSTEIATADEALVEFSTGESRLVLSTCNSFGAKEERIVVSATLDTVEDKI